DELVQYPGEHDGTPPPVASPTGGGAPLLDRPRHPSSRQLRLPTQSPSTSAIGRGNEARYFDKGECCVWSGFLVRSHLSWSQDGATLSHLFRILTLWSSVTWIRYTGCVR